MTADLASIRADAAYAETQAILAALRETQGNVSKAARVLKLSRYQLIRRIHKYGIWGGERRFYQGGEP